MRFLCVWHTFTSKNVQKFRPVFRFCLINNVTHGILHSLSVTTSFLLGSWIPRVYPRDYGSKPGFTQPTDGHTHTYSQLKIPNHLTCVFLDCGRNWRIPTWRTRKVHTHIQGQQWRCVSQRYSLHHHETHIVSMKLNSPKQDYIVIT